jgi:hypothetical protein
VEVERIMNRRNSSGGLAAILFAILAVTSGPARAESDPRFFGDYYGTYELTYTVRIRVWFVVWHTIREERITETYDISAHADYEETPDGRGAVTGSGMVERGSVKFPFSFAGAVTGRGLIKGVGLAEGHDLTAGSGRLSPDGNEITLRGMDRTLVLRKDGQGNQPPIPRIVSPSSAASFRYGESILFRGEATDPEDGTIEAERMVWSSNRIGRLGTGPFLALVTLPVGEHQIRFSVMDSGGVCDFDEIPIEIKSSRPNPPQILSPRTGETYVVGQSIVFRGWASDPEEGKLDDAALTWRSSLVASPLGHGELMTRTLPEGRHTITLVATDSTGLSRKASCAIRVNPREEKTNQPPTVRIVAPEHLEAVSSEGELTLIAVAHDPEDGVPAVAWSDTYPTSSGTTTRNLGSGTSLRISGLTVTGVGDTPHTIRATATDSRSASATDTITIYAIPGGLE